MACRSTNFRRILAAIALLTFSGGGAAAQQSANFPFNQPLAAALRAEPKALWRLEVDETLEQALIRWCRQAGYTLIYETSAEYPVQAPTEFNDSTFPEAVEGALYAFSSTPLPPLGVLGVTNRVLVIYSADDSAGARD